MPTITYTPIPIYVFTNSTGTSNPILVQDYNTISVMVASGNTNISVAVQASNDDGLQPIGGPYGTVPALNWNTISNITIGVFSIAPGMRWLRFGSPTSTGTLVLAGNAF